MSEKDDQDSDHKLSAQDNFKNAGTPPREYTASEIKRSACIVLGGTLTAFFALQAMALYISPDYREGVLDAITPDWIFGEWETEREQRIKALEKRFENNSYDHN